MKWTARDIISIAVLPLIIFVALVVPVYFSRQIDASQLEISCISARSNISQLEALSALERRLGVPQDFEIPKLPEECR